MYVGPFVATWEKIVDIRSILKIGRASCRERV